VSARRLLPVATVPVALASLLAWQARRAVAAEYLPDPAYEVRHIAGDGPEPARVGVLGDSTVAGIGAPSPATSLAAQVAERVARDLGRPVAATGYGISGARTGDISSQAASIAGPPLDAVLVVVGSNDVTHLTPPWVLHERTVTMLRGLRRVAAGAPVVIGGIPEFSTVPALDRPLRDAAGRYAAVLRARQRAAAAEVGVPFVDIAREASPRFLGRPESMSVDGFHPSDVGYGLWADALAPVVSAALAAGRSRTRAAAGDR
jgi:lysophospholipase L1-like esterase